MDQKEDFRQPECMHAAHQNSDPAGWLFQLPLGVNGSEQERVLYARYVRALALLCECCPFVHDLDYVKLIDEVLTDASKHYPLDWQPSGPRRELMLRSPAGE